MSRQDPSIATLRSVCERMARNPADAAGLAASLPWLVQRMPPPEARLMSRPLFERATLWTEVASFESVEAVGEAPPQVIRLQHDVWIRGVECQVIQGVAEPGASLADVKAGLLNAQRLSRSYGSNSRFLVELNWRVDARQGFIGTGTSETLGGAPLITGDGQFSAALDWTLQKDQTIEVRCRSQIADLLADVDPGDLPDLRWVVVTFWGEELNQPSVR